jgi:endonuclease-8
VPAIATPHPRTVPLRLGERLAGQTLQRIEARGKHLLLVFESGLAIHVHLRMTGRLRIAPAGVPIRGPAHQRWLEISGAGIHGVLLHGPVLELLTPAQPALHPVLRRLGGDVMDRLRPHRPSVPPLRHASDERRGGRRRPAQLLVSRVPVLRTP